MSKTEFISDCPSFYNILLDDKLVVSSTLFLNEETVQVNYKSKEEFVQTSYNTNLYVAAFTTANARLRLYKQMSTLGRKIDYCDTDSIFYNSDGTEQVNIGDSLGEWTNELGANTNINKWLCTGPKSYYYKTNKQKECTKIKGFTLNHQNAEKLTGKVMEDIIDGIKEKVEVTDTQITRDKKTKNLVNKEVTKTFSYKFDKRSIQANYDTLPWGYVKEQRD